MIGEVRKDLSASTIVVAIMLFVGPAFWNPAHAAATSGYAGGTGKFPSYEQVSTGETGHAESVKITFDPRKSLTATPQRIPYIAAMTHPRLSTCASSFPIFIRIRM